MMTARLALGAEMQKAPAVMSGPFTVVAIGQNRAHVDADEDGLPRLTLHTSDGSRLVFKRRPGKVN